MVTNVTSLLKTVKAVEDEACRGTRALESTIECIKQELAVRPGWKDRNPHTFVLCLIFVSNVMPSDPDSVPPQLFQSKDAPNKSSTPEEFIRMTKGITMATAKAVAAGNSARQEDIIHTANISRKAISEMLTTCKVPSCRCLSDVWPESV